LTVLIQVGGSFEINYINNVSETLRLASYNLASPLMQIPSLGPSLNRVGHSV